MNRTLILFVKNTISVYGWNLLKNKSRRKEKRDRRETHGFELEASVERKQFVEFVLLAKYFTRKKNNFRGKEKVLRALEKRNLIA